MLLWVKTPRPKCDTEIPSCQDVNGDHHLFPAGPSVEQKLGQGQGCANNLTSTLLRFCKCLVLIFRYQGLHQPIYRALCSASPFLWEKGPLGVAVSPPQPTQASHPSTSLTCDWLWVFIFFKNHGKWNKTENGENHMISLIRGVLKRKQQMNKTKIHRHRQHLSVYQGEGAGWFTVEKGKGDQICADGRRFDGWSAQCNVQMMYCRTVHLKPL